MLKRLFVFALSFVLIPSAWAMTSTLSAPSVVSYPDSINADTYTFTIFTVPGAKVTVVGGSADIAPVTDGQGNDAADGKVQITVGLIQNSANAFSVVAEKDGQISGSTAVTITESSRAPAPTSTAPGIPKLDPISDNITGTLYTLSGSADAGTKVIVRDNNGMQVGSVTVDQAGLFKVNVNLVIGTSKTFRLSAKNDAGVESGSVEVVIKSSGVAVTAEPLTASFTDTANHWSKDYVEKLYQAGVVSGKTSTSFDPEGLITRAELTKLAVAAFGLNTTTVTKNPFPDVSASLWYAPCIEAAKNAGIIGGFPDGTFRPNDPINRAAALKILVLASGYDYAGMQSYFHDVANGSWFYPFVSFAKTKGVVAGYEDGTFKPDRFITRAEAAKIVSVLTELQ